VGFDSLRVYFNFKRRASAMRSAAERNTSAEPGAVDPNHAAHETHLLPTATWQLTTPRALGNWGGLRHLGQLWQTE